MSGRFDTEATPLYELRNLAWPLSGAVRQCFLTQELPPLQLVTGAFGLCFVDEQLLIVGHRNRHEGPPVGHREGKESVEETLRREVAEEACALVAECKLLAVMRITLGGPPPQGYKYPAPVSDIAAYAGRIRALEPFVPFMETTARKLISPEQALKVPWVQQHRLLYEAARKIVAELLG